MHTTGKFSQYRKGEIGWASGEPSELHVRHERDDESTSSFPGYRESSGGGAVMTNDIAISSWNILSPDICERTPTFNRDSRNPERANEFAIDTPGRMRHVMSLLERRMAMGEIVCLQEASFHFMHASGLNDACDRHHYSYVHDTSDYRASRGSLSKQFKPVMGIVILFPYRRYSTVASINLVPFGGKPVFDNVRMAEIEDQLNENSLLLKSPQASGSEKKAASDRIRELRKIKSDLPPLNPDATEKRKDRGVLLVILQDREASDVIFGVATTHVPCDFEDLDLMKEYAIRIKGELKRWMDESINRHMPHAVPVLLCGDMNSEVDSPFYNTMTRGEDHYRDPFKDVRDSRSSTVHGFSEKSVERGLKKPHSLVLDHIFTPAVGMDVVRARHPYISMESEDTQLPNAVWPSDHMPVEITVRVQRDFLFPGIKPGLNLESRHEDSA